ncbi:hypothetical protein J6590_055419 [Homalodisca vitripennis]|nr:hypothetical protein J6590_055419 [Homalodisca vitripennis]
MKSGNGRCHHTLILSPWQIALESVERLVHYCKSPTTALEAMLVLLPLHVKKEAMTNAIRLSQPNRFLLVDLEYHQRVLQGEVYSIQECASILLEKGMKEVTVNIMLDIQATIMEYINTLKTLVRGNQVNIAWVSGHVCIEGNKTADKLTKAGAFPLIFRPRVGA